VIAASGPKTRVRQSIACNGWLFLVQAIRRLKSNALCSMLERRLPRSRSLPVK
jgi:hypothetical protein